MLKVVGGLTFRPDHRVNFPPLLPALAMLDGPWQERSVKGALARQIEDRCLHSNCPLKGRVHETVLLMIVAAEIAE